jgi:Leucine-rich repeat (LRR) protein
MELNSIFPARCSWPAAIRDVREAPQEATAIRLVSKAKNIRELPRRPALKALWCFDIDTLALDAIGECHNLESLYIETLRVDDLSALLRLKNLKTLNLDTCSRVTSIPNLESLQSLRGLAISHFSNVHDLSPLTKLRNLTALAVSGSMWTRMTVQSFQPLSSLKDLEFLHLTNIKAEDGSLEPLHGLTKLGQLDIANFYSIREFALLSRSLGSTTCTWFSPIVEINHTKCPKCLGSKVMLSGKGSSTACPQCQARKVEAHLSKWREALCTAA